MVKLGTLDTLAELEQEMARAGRMREGEALREALRALARSDPGLLTTGQAAERLGVSIPTVKRWVERGALAGGAMGGRWLVALESVERLLRLRESLAALDREGNPTDEELRELYRKPRHPSEERSA
ncbi:MAG: helix-turn-helix domain-containing protein [Chloroflexi bacterium]|nr:helix-turn-helix domain-containing protein [Chloroflexota bacterium]